VGEHLESARPAHRPPSFEYRADLDDGRREMFESTTSTLWAAAAGLIDLQGGRVPDLEVWPTNDVIGTANEAEARVGGATEHATDADRIGGVVAGKTVQADDGSRAVVLVDIDALAPPGNPALVLSIFLVAHELMHVAYGSCRTAASIPPRVGWLPWDLAEMVTVTAAEEYRCDRLATTVMRVVFTATDDAGNVLDPALAVADAHRATLETALDVMDPGLPNTIYGFRTWHMSLDDMWNHVARMTGEFFVYLGHAEATATSDDPVLAGEDHPAVELFRPAWEPWVEYLRTAPLLPEKDTWLEDRQTLMDIGRDGLLEVWRRLGLHPRPEGDTFYLGVTEPGRGPTAA
jgi:hypothetical protein